MRTPAALSIATCLLLGACGNHALSTADPVQATALVDSANTAAPDAQQPAGPEIDNITVLIATDEGGSISLPHGPLVDIPAGALYADSRVSLAQLQAPVAAEVRSYTILGQPFQFDVDNSTVFSSLVTITIPYDPDLLPPGSPESNLFAVYLHDGEWVRFPGTVDEESNNIQVGTLHNGIWSWAVDTIANLFSSEYLGVVSDQPESLDQARAELQSRYAEVLSIHETCQYYIEEWREDIDPTEYVNDALAGVSLDFVDAAILGFGGQEAALMIGGQTIAYWTGAILEPIAGGLYVGPLLGDEVLAARCVLQEIHAYRRYREMNAVFQALERPEQSSFYQDDLQYLEGWLQLQQSGNPSGLNPDWSLSMFSRDLGSSLNPTPEAAGCPDIEGTWVGTWNGYPYEISISVDEACNIAGIKAGEEEYPCVGQYNPPDGLMLREGGVDLGCNFTFDLRIQGDTMTGPEVGCGSGSVLTLNRQR